jgi:hypothetical protein
MEEWVQRLAPPDDVEAQVLLRTFSDREVQLKQEAGGALQEFDRKQWGRWSTTLPRRGAKLRPGTILFKHLALEKWNAAYDLHRLALRNRSKVAFHNLRIGLKRFRYIVENFLPEQHATWKDDLKELQDLLGEVHDLDVLWAAALQVNAFPNVESRLRWQKRIGHERGSRIAKYREKMSGKNSLWRMWRVALPQAEQIQSAALRRLRLWTSFLDPDFKHSENVAKLALQLYDGLSNNGRFSSLEHSEERTILQIAALAHDVGRSVGRKNSHKASSKLIRRWGPPLGLSEDTLRMAAVVARYHAGPLPRSGQKTLLGLVQSERQTVSRLAGVLRLAEAFDADHSGRIHGLSVQEHTGFILITAEGYVARDPLAEKIAAARHLLETVSRCPVLVKPRAVKRAKMPLMARNPKATIVARRRELETLTLLPSSRGLA